MASNPLSAHRAHLLTYISSAASAKTLLPASAQAQTQQGVVNQCIQTTCNPITRATEADIQSCVAVGLPENECVSELAPDGDAAFERCVAICLSYSQQ